MRLGSRGSEDRALSRSLVRRAELEGHTGGRDLLCFALICLRMKES